MTRERKDGMHRDSWVTCRPAIKVYDCAIRDGGLMNSHHFDDDFVHACCQACCAGGMDYMEMGYTADKALDSPTELGPWRFCDEDDIRRIIGDDPPPMKLSAMANAGRTNCRRDILPKEPPRRHPRRLLHRPDPGRHRHPAGRRRQCGYEITVNLMAYPTVPEPELRTALADGVERTSVRVLHVVDSFGALCSEQIENWMKLFKRYAGDDRKIGIHTHNNMQLAYANTIEARIAGASRLDVSINGLGRGTGNCPSKLPLLSLKKPKFRLKPVLERIERSVPAAPAHPLGLQHAVRGLRRAEPASARSDSRGEKQVNELDRGFSRPNVGVARMTTAGTGQHGPLRARAAVAAAAALLAVAAAATDVEDSADLLILRDAAERGDAVAQLQYGDRLATGRNTARDIAMALEWWSRAALQGNADAMVRVADHLASGEGVQRDDVRAVALWRRAADAGHAGAMARLAHAVADGRGVGRDPDAALRWLRRAAEHGHPSAQHELAGHLAATDAAQAALWYERAARQGLTASMLALARLRAAGGGRPDIFEAYVLCRLASRLGDRDAEPAAEALAGSLSPLARFRADRAAVARMREWGLR